MIDPLRATFWSEFVGQEHMKSRLDVHIKASILDERPLGHVLLAGPPGFGKTTLASIIAAQLGDPFASLKMPIKPVALASFLRQFQGGVLLLDEIHCASKSQQEDLLTLLEEGYLQLSNGRKIVTSWLTIIAATTEPEKITPALRNRFPIIPVFDPYSPEEMTEIVHTMARKINLTLDESVLQSVAVAAGGVPRNARQLIEAARDLVRVQDEVTAEDILSLTRTDAAGLTSTHLDYLNCLRQLGGQAGLNLVSTMLRLHETVVRDAERLLVTRDLIMYGDRGRELTTRGWAYGKADYIPRGKRL